MLNDGYEKKLNSVEYSYFSVVSFEMVDLKCEVKFWQICCFYIVVFVVMYFASTRDSVPEKTYGGVVDTLVLSFESVPVPAYKSDDGLKYSQGLRRKGVFAGADFDSLELVDSFCDRWELTIKSVEGRIVGMSSRYSGAVGYTVSGLEQCFGEALSSISY